MVRQVVAAAVTAAILGGCASTGGPDFASTSQTLGPPKAGNSRIVIFREKGSPIALSGYNVKVDGTAMTDLKPGTYVYADRPAGRHILGADEFMFPGTTQREITAQSGRTYYFVARQSQRSKNVTVGAALGGLTGALVASAATTGDPNPGPLDFDPVDEASARAMMAELKLAN